MPHLKRTDGTPPWMDGLFFPIEVSQEEGGFSTFKDNSSPLWVTQAGQEGEFGPSGQDQGVA